MEKRLKRNQHNKMIAGVAAGLADYLDIDVALVRVCLILLAVFGFSGVLIYIVLWIVIPEKLFVPDANHAETDYRVYEEQSASYSHKNPPATPKDKKPGDGRIWAGSVLVIIGVFFMLHEFNIIPYWFSITKLWPVILIACGLGILLRSGRKKTIPPVENPVFDKGVNNTDEEPVKSDTTSNV